MRTPLCDLLGIDQPIVLAPMGGAVGPRLAAAVSNAGGLGVLPLTWAADASVIRETQELTSRPFGGNLILDWDQHERLDAMLDAGLRIVSLFWGNPAPYVDRVHQPGDITIAAAGCPERRGLLLGVPPQPPSFRAIIAVPATAYTLSRVTKPAGGSFHL